MTPGTNSPAKPAYEGQLNVFPSPHARGVWLVDIAYTTRYGDLAWAAVPHDTDVYALSVAHHRRLTQVERKLHQMVRALVATASARMPADVLAPLRQKTSLVTCNRLLRSLAVPLREAGLSLSQLWDVIDATGFFEDAISRQWRYMDYAGRDRCLTWAEQLADRYI